MCILIIQTDFIIWAPTELGLGNLFYYEFTNSTLRKTWLIIDNKLLVLENFQTKKKLDWYELAALQNAFPVFKLTFFFLFGCSEPFVPNAVTFLATIVLHEALWQRHHPNDNIHQFLSISLSLSIYKRHVI